MSLYAELDMASAELLQRSKLWDVYRVINKNTNKFNILKISDQYYFKPEGDRIKNLMHASLSRVLEYGEDSVTKKYYLIREYVEGHPVGEKFTVTLAHLLDLTVELCRVLYYLQSQGLAYLDLKPQNILWNGREAFLIDTSLVTEFVYAKAVPPGGSPAYMPPESFIGGGFFHQSDLYSLGVVLYELVTGNLPFTATDLQGLIHQHLFYDPPHPCLERNDIPREFGDLILRLLQKNPADRFEDANDVILWINKLFGKNWDLEPGESSISQGQKDFIMSKNPLLFMRQAITYLEKKVARTAVEDEELARLYLSTDEDQKLLPLLTRLSQVKSLTIRTSLQNKKGQFGEAHTLLSAALPSMNDSVDSAHLLNNFGRTHFYLGQLEEADGAFKRAGEIFEMFKNWEGYINALCNEGNVLVSLAKRREAHRCYQSALDQSIKHLNPLLEARCTSNLGYLKLFEHDYTAAMHYYRRSYEMFSLMGKRQEKIQAALNLVDMLTLFSSEIKARELLKELFKEETILKNDYLRGLLHLHEANMSLYFHDLKQAAQSVAAGIKLVQNPRDAFHFHLTAVEIALSQSNHAMARHELEKAKKTLHEAKLQNYEPRLQWVELLYKFQSENQVDQILLGKVVEQLTVENDSRYLLRALHWACSHLSDSLPDYGKWQKLYEDEVAKMAKKIPESFRQGFLEQFIIKKENDMEKLELVRPQESFAGDFRDRILKLNEALTSELELGRLLEKIMDALIEITGSERGVILLPEEGELCPMFSKNYESTEKNKKSGEDISSSLSRKVFENDEPIITVDALTDERFSQTLSIHKLKLRSIICLPFSYRGRVMGVVYLDSRLKKTFFDKNKLFQLEPFTHQVAIALQNANLFREKEKQITTLAKALKESREETKFKYGYQNIVGRHETMQNLFSMLDRITDSQVPVMIQGESGVGKEMIAKAIHYNGPRQTGSFISLNCAALPETLLEAELFGAKKGAYTGSAEDRTGLFELAHKGSLFLDEIGDMPLVMQAKLLRVLQEGEVRPLGSKIVKKVDVRIISASNRDLKILLGEKKFREDLFYRLHVAPVIVPALRERKDDIPLLVEHFLRLYSSENKAPQKKVSKGAMMVLRDYGWPGNIRELENFVYQLCIMARADTIDVDDLRLKADIFGGAPALQGASTLSHLIDSGKLSLSRAKQEFEKQEVERVLRLYDGHVTKAASHLQMVRPQLSRMLKQYALKS